MATKILPRTPLLTKSSLRPLPALRLPTQKLFTPQQTRLISAYGYTQSKALTFREYGDPPAVLSLHTHSIPPPHANLLTLRFLASPLNPADINQIQGVYPSKPRFTTALGTPHPIAVAGNEGVAEIIALGDAARQQGFKKGDWVLMKTPGFGTWRTHAQASTDDVVLLREEAREGISAVTAGTVSVNPVTAYRMLKDFADLQPGQWFVQNGANSGVGRAAIQLGKHFGLKSINVIRARDDSAKEEKLRKELTDIGADIVISDAELQDRSIKDKIGEWTNGGRDPIPLALNCVNGKPATAMAKLLSPGAHFVTYGAMSKQPLTIPASALIFKDIHFHGFWVSRWSERHVEEKMRTVEEVLGLVRAGAFRDSPVEEIGWGWETSGEELVGRVRGTLEGYREGKGVFVFEGS